MKVNPRIKVLLAKYTTRINLLFMVGFLMSLSWAYVDYYKKMQYNPNIAWYGFFFKTGESSWQMASPFKS